MKGFAEESKTHHKTKDLCAHQKNRIRKRQNRLKTESVKHRESVEDKIILKISKRRRTCRKQRISKR